MQKDRFWCRALLCALIVVLQLIILGGCGGSSGSTDSGQPVATPTPLPTPAPSLQPTPVPTPSPTPNATCSAGDVCSDFEPDIGTMWSRGTGRGNAQLTDRHAASGRRSVEFKSKVLRSGVASHVQTLLSGRNTVLNLTFDNQELRDLSTYQQTIEARNVSFDDGVASSALSLNGEQSYLEIATSPSLLIDNQLTTSLWYRHTQQSTGEFYSLIEQSADELGGHSRYGTWTVANGQLTTCIEPDTCPNNASECQRCMNSKDFAMTEGQWYHIVSTYTGSELSLFVNGELNNRQSYDLQTGISTRPIPLTLGTDIYADNVIYLTGLIDEVFVDRRPLSPEDINIVFERDAPNQATLLMQGSDFASYGEGMWGRLKFRLEDSGSTERAGFDIVDVSGTSDASFRFGLRGSTDQGFQPQFSFEKLNGSVSCSMTDQSVTVVTESWACLEWHLDTASNRTKYFLNGIELGSLAYENLQCDQPGELLPADGSFSSLQIGVIERGNTTQRTLFIDDVVLASEQPGCD